MKLRTVVCATLLLVAGCAGKDDNNSTQGTPAQRALVFATSTAIGAAQLAGAESTIAAQALGTQSISSFCDTGTATSSTIGAVTTLTFTACFHTSPGGTVTLNGTVTRTAGTSEDTIAIAAGSTVAIASDCFSGTLTVQTTEPLVVAHGAACPKSGVIASSGDFVGTGTFGAGGSVDIHDAINNTDTHFDNCLDADSCS